MTLLETHHRVPQRFHGSDRRENAVGLCHKCHVIWDNLADQGIIYPGISIGEAPVRCFNNSQVKQKVVAQLLDLNSQRY